MIICINLNFNILWNILGFAQHQFIQNIEKSEILASLFFDFSKLITFFYFFSSNFFIYVVPLLPDALLLIGITSLLFLKPKSYISPLKNLIYGHSKYQNYEYSTSLDYYNFWFYEQWKYSIYFLSLYFFWKIINFFFSDASIFFFNNFWLENCGSILIKLILIICVIVTLFFFFFFFFKFKS